jgi:hypothetical protein
LSTEHSNPFVSRSLVRRVAVDLFSSIAVLAGQNKHVVMPWHDRDYEVRGRNPQELLREGFVIRARPAPQCYHAALDVASCSESSCLIAQMRSQLYIAAGLAVSRPRACVGGHRGGHAHRAAAGCCVSDYAAIKDVKIGRKKRHVLVRGHAHECCKDENWTMRHAHECCKDPIFHFQVRKYHPFLQLMS